MAAQNWTLTQVLNQLDSGSHWSGSAITYSFPAATTYMYTNGEQGGFSQLSNLQITFAEYALTSWDELIAATFSEGSGKTNIEIGNTTTGIEYAHAYYPNLGTVWFNPNYDDLTNPVIGDYGYGTYIHEIGHSLGLDHMGDYNGSGNWEPSSYQDSTVLSIMSYFGPDQGNDGKDLVMWADWVKGGVTYAAQTPMLNDIMAIQDIYGADTTTRTGATTYGFNSNITGSAAKFYDFDVNGNPILCIYDSSGNDTLDLSGFSTKCSISLVAGTFSDCNDMTNNISIAYTATIENAVGGTGNDEITGNDVANILTGGRGNDTIDGGDGNDIAVFSGVYANYTVISNGNGSYTITDNVGNNGIDTLSSIELLRFSDKDVGESDSDTAPTVAISLVDQTAEPDTAFLFAIPTGSFTDPNGDTLTYSAALEGGGGLPSWLAFNETTGTFSGTPDSGDLGTLTIVVTASDGTESTSDTFEIVVGDATGATIRGNRRDNNLFGTDAGETILGLGGKDRIHAGAGNDTLEGGAGRDLLWGQTGTDIFKFGNKNGMDDIKDFSLADGDQIDLSGVTAITDYADLMANHFFSLQGDAYIKISKGHDILVVGVDAADLMSESYFIF